MSSLPEKFWSAQVVEFQKDLEFVKTKMPKPDVDQIIVKIEVTGVCHTDLHVQGGDWEAKSSLPITPGHEGVGTVVEKGSGVHHLNIGDRVCIPWLHKSCGTCQYCWSGWETVCENQLRTGFSADGSFAEYVLAHSKFVGKVPENLSSEQAAPITCAGVTVYKGLKVSEVKPGQTVVIVGAAGGLGHVAIQYAKAMGMKVVAVDAGKEKVEIMQKQGADVSIDVKNMGPNETIASLVKKNTNGLGASGALILVPFKKSIEDAVGYMCPLGVIVVIALPPGNFEADVFKLVVNALTIRGSIVGTRQDLQEALEMAALGKVHCQTQVRDFGEVNSTLKDLAAGNIQGRVVLKVDGSDFAKKNPI